MAIGTPVQIGTGVVSSGVSANVVVTTIADSAAGNLISVKIASSLTCHVTGVTDSAGNTYALTTEYANGTNGGNLILAYKTNAAALPSGGTITVAFDVSTGNKYCSASSTPGIMVTATPLDITAAGVNSVSATTLSTATGTLGQADELVEGWIIIAGGQGQAPTASGFTALTSAEGGSSSSGVWPHYQIVSSTGSVTYAPTWSVAHGCAAQAVSFKAGPDIMPQACL